MIAWSDADVAALGEGRVLVHDGVLGPHAAPAAAALEAMDAASGPGRIRGRTGDVVRTDRIAWLDPVDAAPALHPLLAWLDALRETANEAAWLGLGRYELQVACYEPGGGYAPHVDAFHGRSTRRLTAIWYGNPNWNLEDGGALRAWEPGGVVEIAPILDRAVVFLSQAVRHEVLPAIRRRRALTAWYRGKDDPA